MLASLPLPPGVPVDESTLSLGVVLALAFIAVIILVIFFQFIPFGLWLTALFSGIRISFFTLFGMRFRRVDPRAIVIPLISGHKAGIQLNVNDLEIGRASCRERG